MARANEDSEPSFADLLKESSARGSRCHVCQALIDFGGEDVADLKAALETKTATGTYVTPAATISRALRRRGYKSQPKAVTAHRNDECDGRSNV